VIYLANPCGGVEVAAAMRAGQLGFIATPAQGNGRPPGVVWCADNGVFGSGYPGDAGYLAWLAAQAGKADCLFAVAPDVVADAAGTLTRSAPFLDPIRRLGYPVALAAQDGLEQLAVPWADFDVLFVGGSTGWKLGAEARQLVGEARSRGKWVHFARVNSERRFRYAHHIGCNSADGTFLTFGPRRNLPQLLAWVRGVADQPALFAAPWSG
jgi:hypothetical protein